MTARAVIVAAILAGLTGYGLGHIAPPTPSLVGPRLQQAAGDGYEVIENPATGAYTVEVK